jgi:hypothetical protein
MPTVVVWKPSAPETITELAKPGLRPAADAIAGAIPGFVPVHDGTMRASYKLRVEEGDDGFKVYVGSPFWHWMEYGTRFNAASRPVQTAVTSLGLRYEAH